MRSNFYFARRSAPKKSVASFVNGASAQSAWEAAEDARLEERRELETRQKAAGESVDVE